MNKKVSIVVPIYNASKYLHKCIKSLINQSYKNIEIILVNDGSTDKSLDICIHYQINDKRIKVIDIHNEGVSNARNVGIDLATGNFIMFCDSDDYVSEKWCEILIDNYREENLVMCDYYRIDNGSILNLNDERKNNYTIDKSRFLELESLGLNVPWNKIFDLNIIKKNNIKFDKRLSLGEDLLFNLQYLNCISEKIIFLKDKLYYYNLPRTESLSKKIIKNYDKQCNLLFKKIKFYMNQFNVVDLSLWKSFYNMMFFQFEKALNYNLLNKDYNILKRIKKNNLIMKSNEYRICSLNSDISPNKIYKWCYKRKNYYFVYLLKFILNSKYGG